MEDAMTLDNAMAIAREQETADSYEYFVSEVKQQMRQIDKLSKQLKKAQKDLAEMEFVPPTI